jgi:hypothetical protein
MGMKETGVRRQESGVRMENDGYEEAAGNGIPVGRIVNPSYTARQPVDHLLPAA